MLHIFPKSNAGGWNFIVPANAYATAQNSQHGAGIFRIAIIDYDLAWLEVAGLLLAHDCCLVSHASRLARAISSVLATQEKSFPAGVR